MALVTDQLICNEHRVLAHLSKLNSRTYKDIRRIYKQRHENRGAEGTRIEAPRVLGSWMGVSPSGAPADTAF